MSVASGARSSAGSVGAPPNTITIGAVKDTNVEVCVRIRPLVVDHSADQSEKFFDNSSSPKRAVKQGRMSGMQRPKASATKSRLKTPTPRKPGLPTVSPTKEDDGASTSTATTAATSTDPRADPSGIAAWIVDGDDTVQQSAKTDRIQGRTHAYTLDRVYGPTSTTQELYQNSVKPVIMSAMEGYHCSVFAYGQTSTGKTHTISGTKQSPGIVPLAVQDCFNYVKEMCDDEREFLLRVSYLEIYNEQIVDLLSETPVAVRIFENPKEGVIIRGLREEVVTSTAEVYQLIKKGEKRRQVGSTNMNTHSSRSHAVFRLWIESKSPDGRASRVSTLSLVDLAGSESARLTGSTGQRQREGQYINKSLMALGQVVYKLSELKRRHDDERSMTVHIPYRDSKLTRLLQPSLSGNAQIVVICTISPQVTHLEESHNTLKFAARAKKIEQRVTIQEVEDEKTLLQSYRAEIEELHKQLEEARQRQKEMEAQVASTSGTGNRDSDEGIADIVEAIQKMERLILKTQAMNQKLHDDDDMLLLSPNADPESLVKDVPAAANEETPQGANGNSKLLEELKRIQGMLGSVLSKNETPALSPTKVSTNTAGASFSTPSRDVEVEALRAQLHEQEVTTSLRKADSSFLQAQLAEKDALLEEVSNILEDLEKRQKELEEENTTLKEDLDIALAEKAVLEKKVIAASKRYLV